MLSEKEPFSKQTPIYIPAKIISSLEREFDIPRAELDSFVTALIERTINDRIAETNSKVFSGCEVKELEDDLKGLGYI